MKKIVSSFLGVIVLLLILLVVSPCTVQAQNPSDVRTVDLGEVEISYELTGSGPPLVLIHGYTHNMRTWNLQMSMLRDYYQVLRYDRRGWGDSGGFSDPTMDPEDLAELLDHLDIPAAHILGHSQGAHVALRFSMAYPDKVENLILYGSPAPSGFGIPWTGPDAFPANMSQIAKEHGLDSVGVVIFSHPLARGFVEGSPGSEIASEMWESYDGTDLLNPQPPSNDTPPPKTEGLSKVKASTLIITGELEMPYFQLVAEAFDYAIPNSERVTVPGGGHAVHLQEPERFTAEILRFLKN